MYSWDSIENMFQALHAAECEYVIMRNHEEIDEDNFYTSGHADIDFLTADHRLFTRLLHAVPRFGEDDGIHYTVCIKGTEVVLDVRSVGDGYYDTHWQRHILRTRQLHDGRFYVQNAENYYHSLVYHAILQKKELAVDYLLRLNAMGAGLGLSADTQAGHLRELERFMREKHYSYTVPYDIWVPLRTELIDGTMVKKNPNIYVRDLKIRLMQTGSRIKRRLLRRK